MRRADFAFHKSTGRFPDYVFRNFIKLRQIEKATDFEFLGDIDGDTTKSMYLTSLLGLQDIEKIDDWVEVFKSTRTHEYVLLIGHWESPKPVAQKRMNETTYIRLMQGLKLI